jgi:MoaA/NifB/PqqE/SkfB family radical SAM enzyme
MMTNKEFAKFYVDYIKYAKEEIVNIETTYRCPLQCPFCQRQDPDPRTNERISKSTDISFSNYKKLVQFASNFSFCGQISDPIYHANFLELLKETQKYPSKKFFISTTGTRKKIEWWKEAFSYSGQNIRWIFGLDGTDQETANIYRVNTKFDEVLEVMKLGASMGCIVRWQFIVFQHNEHQIEEAKKIAKEIGVDLKIQMSGRWRQEDMDKYKIYPPSDKWKSTNSVTKEIIIFNKK